MQRRALLAYAATGLTTVRASAGFDHGHGIWHHLLREHVRVSASGYSSTVRYVGMQRDRSALRAYLAGLTSVTTTAFQAWGREHRLAFLINAYNAFTVELVLSRYPDLRSIQDLGSLFRSVWKQRFFRLLGQDMSLDDLEHGHIRRPGVFDDARIHVAVVCASRSCPMLRPEAYVAERLDAQLDDAMRRFLSDRERNRFEAGTAGQGVLRVSKIFAWYRSDFERPGSFENWVARHADLLADASAARAALRAGRYQVAHTDYDWSLNDADRP